LSLPDRPEDTARGRAVALGYDDTADDAPRVLAKGEGEVAERIVALAREHGIPVRRDADLATLLSAVELEGAIPVEAFEAVARILAHIYRANGRMSVDREQDPA